MSCPTPEQLAGYCDGRLPDPTAQAIAAHLESCPRCEAAIAAMEEDAGLMKRLSQPVAQNAYLGERECQQALEQVQRIKTPGEQAAAARTPPMPNQIREYQLLERLGEGGMGVVYKALHTSLDKLVAIKVLPAAFTNHLERVARFQREMKAVGKLEDPHVVRAMDAFQVDDQHYLVMEYVDGIDLSDLLRRAGKLQIADACELVRQAALGLRAAEAHDLVHRDIKPSNLILNADGQLKILDLGLATFQADVPGAEDPETSEVMGTPDYMSPEQASGSPTIDIRADIYSLGCTFYKLLTGEPPFSGPQYKTKLDKLTAHVRDPIPPIRSLRADVPERLAAVLDRMLAKDPSARFPRPGHVAEELKPFCPGADLAGLYLKAGKAPAVPGDTDRSRAITHAPPPPPAAAGATKPAPEPSMDPYYKWLGIPPEEQPPNHYRLLGLRLFEDNREVIDTAVARQAAHLRTYQLGKHVALCQRLLKEVHVAKACLMDPKKKAAYDAQLRAAQISPLPLRERGGGEGAFPASPGRQPGGADERGQLVAPPPLDPGLAAALAEAARAKHTARTAPGPRWPRPPLSLLIAAGSAAAVFLLGVVIYWSTNHGTVKIELLDPNANVETRIDGERMSIAGLKEPLTLSVGPHELKVTSGEFETFTKSFVIRRGGQEVVRVALMSKAAGGMQNPPATIGSPGQPADAKLTVGGKVAMVEGQDAERKVMIAGSDGKTNFALPAVKEGRQTQSREIQPKPADKGELSFGHVALPRSDDWIDLLKSVDLKRDLVEGQWKQEADGFVVSAGPYSRIMLPVVIDGSYDLEVVFSRHAGFEDVLVYFPVGWQEACLALGSRKQKGSSFWMIGCWGNHPRNPSYREGDLVNDRLYTAQINVRVMGSRVSLQGLLDGQVHLQWQGERGTIGLHDAHVLPNLRRPGLGADESAVTFHSARLRVVSDSVSEPGKLRLLRVGETYEEPFATTERHGGKGVAFHDLASADAYLAGFRLFLFRNESVHAIQPLYRSSRGIVDGIRHGGDWSADGAPTGLGEPKVVLSKEGYGVGSISLGGLSKKRPRGFSGMRVTFMRVKDRKFDPAHSYQSQWIGTAQEEAKLESRGELTAGIQGAFAGGIVSLGLLLASPSDKSSAPLAVAPFDEQKPKEHQQAWAKHLGVPVEMTNSIGMKFLLIPPGEFDMGSPDSDKDTGGNEKPCHRVRISKPFCLGMYEVTQGEYERVMRINPSYFSANGNGKDKVAGQDTGRFPVEQVSWDDVMTFCHKLSGFPEETAAGRVYRLPAEAEWEYACRAGTRTEFSFGNSEAELESHAWFHPKAGGMPHPVGQKRPNPWGVFDTHGNVWEWCADWYDGGYYKQSPSEDPAGPSATSSRVIRGASWGKDASWCRSAFRIGAPPSLRVGVYGFRVVCEISGQQAGSVKPKAEKPAAGGQKIVTADQKLTKILEGTTWKGTRRWANSRPSELALSLDEGGRFRIESTDTTGADRGKKGGTWSVRSRKLYFVEDNGFKFALQVRGDEMSGNVVGASDFTGAYSLKKQ